MPGADVLALAVLLQAQAPAAAILFTPPIDRPLLVTTIRTQTEGGEARRIESRRKVRFHRDGEGYLAEVTIEASQADQAGEAGIGFEAGLARLIGVPMRFRLDHAGRVTSVEDREALWLRFGEAVANLALERQGKLAGDRRAHAARLSATLRLFPVERQHAVLASLIAPLIVSDNDRQSLGLRATRVPGQAFWGERVMLDGRQHGTLAAGRLRVETDAEGPLPPREGMAAGRMRATIVRELDTATGLLVQGSERSVTTLGDRISEIHSTLTVAPAS